MKDYWNLRKIFRFSSIVFKYRNDTEKTVVKSDQNGKEFDIEPDKTIIFGSMKKENDYIISNNDIIKISNNQNVATEFIIDKQQILTDYTDALERGQIIEAISFLDYHYKFSKDKKSMLRFVKYYILPKNWMTSEQREKNTINDIEIERWVKNKEHLHERRIYIFVLLFLIALIAIASYLFGQYEEIIIGVILGALITQIAKMVDKLFQKV